MVPISLFSDLSPLLGTAGADSGSLCLLGSPAGKPGDFFCLWTSAVSKCVLCSPSPCSRVPAPAIRIAVLPFPLGGPTAQLLSHPTPLSLWVTSCCSFLSWAPPPPASSSRCPKTEFLQLNYSAWVQSFWLDLD